jgi:hypothetical protein
MRPKRPTHWPDRRSLRTSTRYSPWSGPGNIRAEATAHRNGTGWVGITDKYFQMTLIVYRLRPADLDRTTQQNQLPGAPAHEPSWGKDQ